MPDPLPIQVLVLATVDASGLTQLCRLLGTLPPRGAEAHHIAILAEPLSQATLAGWLAADGRPLQALIPLGDMPSPRPSPPP
jgi:hypothetical protein